MREHPQGQREIRGYDAVRKAARNSAVYSSDLLGDADVRDYRQLPLEVDPPRHTELRLALMPMFSADRIEPLQSSFKELAEELLLRLSDRGGGDIVREVALPYAMGCLSLIFNRPQDRDEWISWGPNVWLAQAYMDEEKITPETKKAQRNRDYSMHTQRSSQVLHEYLHRVLDEAAHHGPEEDVWSFLRTLRPGGNELTRNELLGIGSVLLAGGRDTVIKLVTGLFWHAIGAKDDRERLVGDPSLRKAAIHEMARFLSPLPKIERTPKHEHADALNDRVVLSFVSANHDRTVFEDPERIVLERAKAPGVAFGFGRHSCLGLQITEHEATAFLDALLAEWAGWEFKEEPVVEWVTESDGSVEFPFLDEFVRVVVAPTKDR